MATLKLRVSDKILDKVIWLLRQFKKEDLEIIEESASYIQNKEMLQSEINRIERNEAKFLSIEEADVILEKTIKQNES
jgi:hypothetical protein